MRLTVTSNGATRKEMFLEEISSIVSLAEYRKLKDLKVGETYEREPFSGQSGTYEFKATRTA